MRKEDEVRKAHDALTALVQGEVNLGYRQRDLTDLYIARDVLCWVLEHRSNPFFARNLKEIYERAAARGAELTPAEEHE